MKYPSYIKTRNRNMDYQVKFFRDGGISVTASLVLPSGRPGSVFRKNRGPHTVPEWIVYAKQVADLADPGKELPLPDGWVGKYVYFPTSAFPSTVYHFYSTRTKPLPEEYNVA